MERATIVIPTFNEESSIGDLLAVLADNPRVSQIIVVDDHSTDGTRDRVLAHAGRDHRIKLIQRSKPRSFAESYREGFSAALADGADVVIQMDADGSHPPGSLNDMLDALRTHDFAVGSRFVSGSKTSGRSAVRRGVSRFGNCFARLALTSDITDLTGGFNGWHADVLREVIGSEFPYRGFVIQVWLKQQAGKRHTWKEIPIHFKERVRGDSKFNWNIFKEGVVGVVQMRFSRTGPANAAAPADD